MDDKTAEIPSLKEFKENRKEHKAQTDRSRSMQTKKQLKSSAEQMKKEHNRGKSAQSLRKAETERNKVSQNRRYAQTSSKRSAEKPTSRMDDTKVIDRVDSVRHNSKSDNPRTASDSTHQRTVRTQSSSAPRTYARDRINGESEPVRTQKNRTASTADKRPRNTSQQRRTSTQGKGSAPKSQATPPKKPKKPLSPAARKFRSIVAYVGILLVVLVVGVILSLTVLFKTEQITVSGNGDYSAQEIISASGLHLGENIFTAPKGRAGDRIEKEYPAIEKADVYLVFPNTINIDITMAKPACVIEALGGYYVVSGQGKVLEVAATADEVDAPMIEGLTIEGRKAGEFVEYGSDIVSTALSELFRAFAELGATDITAINLSTEDDVTVEFRYVYDDRIVVYMGIPEHITYKVQTAQTIIKEKIDVNDGIMAGDLDVSMCYDTKKSYFNEYTLLAQNSAPVEETTAEETTSAE